MQRIVSASYKPLVKRNGARIHRQPEGIPISRVFAPGLQSGRGLVNKVSIGTLGDFISAAVENGELEIEDLTEFLRIK